LFLSVTLVKAASPRNEEYKDGLSCPPIQFSLAVTLVEPNHKAPIFQGENGSKKVK
jgi:hypothetical protein